MHWLVQGDDSANRVQNQTTCYPYMVTRQRKTGHVNVKVVCSITTCHGQLVLLRVHGHDWALVFAIYVLRLGHVLIRIACNWLMLIDCKTSIC